MAIHFPNESEFEMVDTDLVAKLIQESGKQLFDADLQDQAA